MQFIRFAKAALLSILIFQLFTWSEEKGLLGYWSFDEGEGIVAKDSSGYGSHGLISGAAEWTEGISGKALVFDGASVFVDCGSKSVLTQDREAQTIEAWVKHRGTGKFQEIASQGWGHRLFLWSDGGFAYNELSLEKKDVMLRETKPSAVEPDQWVHVVAVYEGAGKPDAFSIYINGVRTAKRSFGSQVMMALPNPLTLGGRVGDKTTMWKGVIDEVAIYNRALSESEIKKHYESKGQWFDKKTGQTEKQDRKENTSDVNFETHGWKFNASFISENKLVLTGEALAGQAQMATAKVVFPILTRDFVKTFALHPASNRLTMGITLPHATLNPRNIYQVDFQVENDKTSFRTTALVKGEKANVESLGQAKLSSEIKNSIIGTCLHFNFSTGPFADWARHDEILELISSAGIKWIRDGVKVEAGADGVLHVREFDLAWIKKAKAKGLEIICEIALPAALTPEEFAQRCTVAATELKGLVNVFELGNEPNNFGGWLKKYGGTWNGKEKDGSTSPWVREHVKSTDAGAAAIKKINPSATTIGLGSPTPVNIRALEIGVSEHLDGVVDHPYTYSMPPERMPYGKGFKDRDGIDYGDDKHSFRGLMLGYKEAFRRTGRDRSIWITEFGFTSFRFSGSNEAGLFAGFSEKAQAVYLARQFIESMTLPISVACQYDFMDDYGSNPYLNEANFGLVRSDLSPKPAYFMVQRLSSLFSGFSHDKNALVNVTNEPLHRSMKRAVLLSDWDKVQLTPENGVFARAFSGKNEKLLAVWSAQPYSEEFNSRVATIRVKGFEGYQDPVVVDLITGKTYDPEYRVESDKEVIFPNLPIGNNPLVIKMFN